MRDPGQLPSHCSIELCFSLWSHQSKKFPQFCLVQRRKDLRVFKRFLLLWAGTWPCLNLGCLEPGCDGMSTVSPARLAGTITVTGQRQLFIEMMVICLTLTSRSTYNHRCDNSASQPSRDGSKAVLLVSRQTHLVWESGWWWWYLSH